jgi:hypothetical protein
MTFSTLLGVVVIVAVVRFAFWMFGGGAKD